jgi:hypothetical protein
MLKDISVIIFSDFFPYFLILCIIHFIGNSKVDVGLKKVKSIIGVIVILNFIRDMIQYFFNYYDSAQ